MKTKPFQKKQLEMYGVSFRDIIHAHQELLEGRQDHAIEQNCLTAYYIGTKNEVSPADSYERPHTCI